MNDNIYLDTDKKYKDKRYNTFIWEKNITYTILQIYI